ncbi:GNAT family N-acetyltransferase [Thalassotalea marina]|uniref:GNAT family N-acetyltransferase n=1 Tax=Thalassotalea marina TaxID=1673741 RepID=A0A919EP03_9GAMM|nr:GNAT family N-acetyltransferase [Thalassotalea marina]GHG01537.1 hypothetical protein GCM10017161_32840 [Thalassotalea marina]
MQLSILPSIDDISAHDWQRFLSKNSSPFIQHSFLSALESSKSVHANTGWFPYHLKLHDKHNIHALLPMYVKSHSWGEYVFDWAWAEAYERYNIDYYPKLLVAIPFTPVPTLKLLSDTLHITELFSSLTAICQQSELNSWHFLFASDITIDEQQLAQLNVYTRYSVQFHWHNKNYHSFEHYLSFFNSRKRKQVLKERRSITEQKITIRRVKGCDISTAELQYFYQVYQQTYLARNHQPHLTLEFFQQICRLQGQQMLFVFANKDNNDVACALFFTDENNLYGRYWDCSNHVNNLHFELCYYQGIEYCIEHGLKHFNPGTQGEHKLARGFEPVVLKSFHWIKDTGFRSAIRAYCQQEQIDMLSYAKQCRTHLPFK